MWFFSPEHRLLQESVQNFAKQNVKKEAAHFDELETLNLSAFKQMGQIGLLGLSLPNEFGGSGADAVSSLIAMEEIASADASLALSYLAHSILCAQQIATHGSNEQKSKYLPKLCSGEWIGGMAMSEPEAGSDALGMQTSAIPFETPLERGYLLKGSKMWVTNGPIGHLFFVYARSGPFKKNISSFLVESSFQGFSRGNKIAKHGMRASPTGELVFQDTWLSEKQLIGKKNKSLEGMMENLDLERILISGISLGIARSAIQVATQYAQERKTFSYPIGAYQQVQERLAEASVECESARALSYQAAKEWDLHHAEKSKKFLSYLAAASKLKAAQMATKVCGECVQILGGYGYTREFPVERYLRDAKLIEIGAGTNEILRIIIARHLLGREVADALFSNNSKEAAQKKAQEVVTPFNFHAHAHP